MAVNIWPTATAQDFQDNWPLSDTTWAAILVKKGSGTTATLLFKRTDASGAWPADSAAHTVASCTHEPHVLRERDGELYISNSKTLFLRANGLAPTSSADWTPLTVMQ